MSSSQQETTVVPIGANSEIVTGEVKSGDDTYYFAKSGKASGSKY